ncbi:unnamed protein product [Sympodiomycopsis kandeliae]
MLQVQANPGQFGHAGPSVSATYGHASGSRSLTPSAPMVAQQGLVTPPEKRWIQQLNRQLLYLMTWSRYPDTDVQRFNVFFDEIIRPSLEDARIRDNATSNGSKWLWPSFMTDSNDPVEVGMAWKGGSGPQVRFAIEAIGKGEIMDRRTNLSASNQLADALADVGLISREVYADLQQVFAPVAKEHSQVFFGFDLNRGGTIDVKLYFVLDRESSSNPESLASSLKLLDDKHHTTFEKSCQSFAQNIHNLPQDEQGHGVIVAFDISGQLNQSRCKLYWRFPTFDIDTVSKRAAYQGGEQEQAAFRNLLSDCWEQVLNRSNKDTAELQGITQRKTGGTLVYFDLCDGVRSKSKAKVYISVRHLFEGSTSVLAQRVEDFLIQRSPAVEKGLADAIYESSRATTSNLKSSESFASAPEEWMTYLCTEVDKSGRPGFCVYFRSCVSN